MHDTMKEASPTLRGSRVNRPRARLLIRQSVVVSTIAAVSKPGTCHQGEWAAPPNPDARYFSAVFA